MKKQMMGVLCLSSALAFAAGSCARLSVETGRRLDRAGVEWARRTMAALSLEEKIGQMIACRATGRFFHRENVELRKLQEQVKGMKVGGLVVFGGEIYETAHLLNGLQRMAEVPLLIASDLERGLGNQLDRAVLFPPLMALGATGSEELAFKMGEITAGEARAVGIHMTYAPVVDVNIDPDNPIINTRSFGQDPELVGRLAAAFIRGVRSGGLLATAKHFPGHGDTAEDSHSLLPTISVGRERLEKVELYPFRAAIEAGVDAVMTAHLHLPALDPAPDRPATLSPAIISGLLRQELGFSGLIVTDAMDMGGITSLYAPGEAALLAVKAGVDLILLPPDPAEVIQTLVSAVRAGQILERRIDSSVLRILEAKARLGLHRSRLVPLEAIDSLVGDARHFDTAREVFERSMTLVKNDAGIVPLSGTGSRIAVCTLSSDPGGLLTGQPFVRLMEERIPGALSVMAEPSTGPEQLEKLLDENPADVVVFAVFSRLRSWKGSVDIDHGHAGLIRRAAAGNKRVVVISFGSPFFIRRFPDVDVYLCAYRDTEEAQQAAVRALFGEIDIGGKLPVSIPGLCPLGQGIELTRTR